MCELNREKKTKLLTRDREKRAGENKREKERQKGRKN